MSVFRTEADPITADRADAAAPVQRLDDETADTAWARRVLHIDALSKTHPLGAELKTKAGTLTGDADARHYRTEISRLDTKDNKNMGTKKKNPDTRTDAAPEKTVKELARERAQILVLALRHGVKTIHVDGKTIDVVDADDVDAVLLALAKKTFPGIDLEPLELTSEQLLALASQIAGMKPAPKESPLAPPPEDGDMPPDDEEEEPIDGRGDRRDPFEVLDRLDSPREMRVPLAKKGRTYADAHEAMERRLRAGRHYRAPRQDGAPSHDSITDLGARLDARLASYGRR
ncbi:MAG: hypothetical protein JNL21_27640 [Myxococcales bacterium]|nr:hypothetical protein [Myxococcales bacterium]